MIQGGDPVGDRQRRRERVGRHLRRRDQSATRTLYRDGYRRGIVAMANSGPNTNGSQFFIMHTDYPLPPNYVIFARVTSGLEAVDAIAETPVTTGPGGEPSLPTTPPVIKKVTIRP